MLRILLADDNANVRDFWRRELTAKGHQVTEAGSAAEVVQAIESKPQDLIVMDIEMPGNGKEIMSRMLTQNRIPVVIYSTGEEGREYVGTGSVKAFVSKTANPEGLMEAIAAIVRAST